MIWVRLVKANSKNILSNAKKNGVILEDAWDQPQSPEEMEGIAPLSEFPKGKIIANIDGDYISEVGDSVNCESQTMKKLLKVWSPFNGYIYDNGKVFIDVAADSALDDVFFGNATSDEEDSKTIMRVWKEIKPDLIKIEKAIEQKLK